MLPKIAIRTPLPSKLGFFSRKRSAPISFLGMSEAIKSFWLNLQEGLLFSISIAGGGFGEGGESIAIAIALALALAPVKRVLFSCLQGRRGGEEINNDFCGNKRRRGRGRGRGVRVGGVGAQYNATDTDTDTVQFHMGRDLAQISMPLDQTDQLDLITLFENGKTKEAACFSLQRMRLRASLRPRLRRRRNERGVEDRASAAAQGHPDPGAIVYLSSRALPNSG